MRLPGLISAVCLMASPLMAQDSSAPADSVARYFGQTCLKYAPDVQHIANWADGLGLEPIQTGPLSMFELIYNLTVTNGQGVTYLGKTREGVAIEMHLTIFTQDGQPYYGCSIGTPDVSGAALEAAIKERYGLPGQPVLTEMFPSMHHRMWNFGDNDDPQYFILMVRPDPSEPATVVANFGKI